MAGAVGTSIVIISIFSTSLDGWSFVVFFAVIYILFSVTFTMNDISYWSMIPALSRNENDRNKLTSLTALCAGVGMGIVGIAVPVFTVGRWEIGGSNVIAYKAIAILTGIIFIGCQLMTTLVVKEPRFVPDGERKNLNLKKMIQVIRNNDQVLWVALMSLMYNVGMLFATMQSYYLYFEFGYDGVLTTAFGVFSTIAGMAVNVFFTKLSKKYGKKNLMKKAIVCITVGYILLCIFGLSVPAGIGLIYQTIGLKFILMAIAYFFVGYGQSSFYLVTIVTFANAVEYNEWKTGERYESVIFTLRPLIAKLGSALLQLVVMIVCLAIGILKYTNQIADYENAAAMKTITESDKLSLIDKVILSVTSGEKTALILCMTIIPIVLMGVGYIVYKKKIVIDEDFYAKMVKEIAERKAGV